MISVMEEHVLFARNISPEVNAHLQAAVACADEFERARELLQQAIEADPEQLETYIALYKFLFYRGRIEEAELVVDQAMKRAADCGGFSADWRLLTSASSDWSGDSDPVRVYLYSLKALAFIKLRQGARQEGREILDKLAQLDPLDQVGGSVIKSLEEAL